MIVSLPSGVMIFGSCARTSLLSVAMRIRAALASRSLRQRDAAVREGILAREGHALESLLRAATPAEAPDLLATFLAERSRTLAGVAVVGPVGVVASAGEDAAGGFELTAALGREWRPAALGAEAEPYITRRGPKWHVDLKGVNARWLEKAGVRQIDVSPDCTACHPELYWSHRRMGQARGAQIAMICL